MKTYFKSVDFIKSMFFIFVLLCIIFCTLMDAYADEGATMREQIANYVHKCNSKVDAKYVADAIVTVFYDEYNQDPWLWTFIIDRESNFDTTAVSPSGKHFHWTQLARDHKRLFKGHGLTWMDDFDMLRFSACMVQDKLDKGKSLFTAFKPWETRKGAFTDYKKKFGKWLK